MIIRYIKDKQAAAKKG